MSVHEVIEKGKVFTINALSRTFGKVSGYLNKNIWLSYSSGKKSNLNISYFKSPHYPNTEVILFSSNDKSLSLLWKYLTKNSPQISYSPLNNVIPLFLKDHEEDTSDTIPEEVDFKSQQKELFSPLASSIISQSKIQVGELISDDKKYMLEVLTEQVIDVVRKKVVDAYMTKKMGNKHLIIYAERLLKEQILRNNIPNYSAKFRVEPIDYFNSHYRAEFKKLKLAAPASMPIVDGTLNAALTKAKQSKLISLPLQNTPIVA